MAKEIIAMEEMAKEIRAMEEMAKDIRAMEKNGDIFVFVIINILPNYLYY